MESGNSTQESTLEKNIKDVAYLLYDIFVEQELLHDVKLHDEESCSNKDSDK